MAVQQPQTARIQIALRRFGILLTLTLAAACGKDEEVPSPIRLTLSQEIVLLADDAAAAATVDLWADGAWIAETSGEGYAVTPTQGGAGTTPLRITATEENDTPGRRALGAILIRLADDPGTSYRLEVVQRPATASQTLLLYMPGRSLFSYYRSNIDGIKTALDARTPGDGRILVCYQPDFDRAQLSEIGFDAETQQSFERELITYEVFRPDMPDAVARLFADAMEQAPARSYGLIIGCHGKAWLPVGVNVRSLARGERPFGPEDDLWNPPQRDFTTRSFGDSSRELEITELASAIEAQERRFDYLIFDACFMANIETLWDLRNAAARIVASPCEIMGAGFPYERIVPRLFADDGASCDLEGACYEFWDLYMNRWESLPYSSRMPSGCISMVVTERLEALADIVRRINGSSPKMADPNALQSYEGLFRHLFYDLGDYIEAIASDAGALDEFRTRLDEAFPVSCRLHTPSFYSVYNGELNPVDRYSGVSVSEPSLRHTEENRRTAWYLRTH